MARTTIEVDLLIQRLMFHLPYQQKGNARIHKEENTEIVLFATMKLIHCEQKKLNEEVA